MSGNMSRRKGNRAMVAVVTWLREHGYPRATRRQIGEDGDDILEGMPGLSIEVKDHARLDLAGWVAQAQAQSGGLPAVVIHKRKGTTDVGRWYVTMTVEDLHRLVAGR